LAELKKFMIRPKAGRACQTTESEYILCGQPIAEDFLCPDASFPAPPIRPAFFPPELSS